MEKHIPKNPLRFGVFISKLYKKWALCALFFVFVASSLSQFTIIILSRLTDAIAAKPLDSAEMWHWAVLYPLVFLLSQTSWRLSGFTGMQWFMNYRFSAYQSLYEYLTLHSRDYFNNRFAGALSNKITNAVDGTQTIFERTLWQFLPLMLIIFWCTGFAFFSDYRLGLIILIWSTFFLSLNVWFAKKLQPHSFKNAETGSILRGKVVDSLSNISLVHEYAYVTGERNYIKQYILNDKKAGLALWQLSEWMLLLNGFLIFLFMATMIATSVYLFQQQIVTAGVVVMVVAIVVKLADQLLFLGQELRDAIRYYGEAKEGLSEILQEHSIIDAPDAKTLTSHKGSIEFASVDFDYDNKNIFSSFSLTIKGGEKVGIVGKSGAGKTTLVSLLLRHFDIRKGEILIDGQNISEVTQESLRKNIAFVPQDTSMFHRTILENVRYSNPKATDDDVQKAARLAHADDFIQKLPEKYKTLVGERGLKLSGGQRQRIAIARAFLKKAPILILDEATSSLDSASEQKIQESLDMLMKEKTVIAIAHRLSTLKKMDRIIVIESGKIIEDGNPDELLKKHKGIFKNMWDHQVKGFITDK